MYRRSYLYPLNPTVSFLQAAEPFLNILYSTNGWPPTDLETIYVLDRVKSYIVGPCFCKIKQNKNKKKPSNASEMGLQYLWAYRLSIRLLCQHCDRPSERHGSLLNAVKMPLIPRSGQPICLPSTLLSPSEDIGKVNRSDKQPSPKHTVSFS